MQIICGLPEAISIESLIGSLPLKAGQPEKLRQKRCHLDTFDGRIHASGWSLWREPEQLILHRGSRIDRLAVTARPPIKATDLPDDEAGSLIGECIENRALLCLLEVNQETTRWPLLDDEEKTQLYLDRVKLSAAGGRRSTLLFLTGLRGYQKNFNACAARLLEAGCEPAESPLETWATQSLPVWPQAAQIHAEMPAFDALRLIALHQLEVMELNEAGVIKGLDVEFLHDFRVALRRTRSLLGRLRGVLARPVEEGFRHDFSKLGTQTGKVRDLDVWLEQLDAQKQALPPRLRDSLEPLIRFVRHDQRRAARALASTLESASWRDLKARWRMLLEHPQADAHGPVGDVPIASLAADALHRRIRRVIKDGERIQDDSPDEQLHVLRIDCKKLRYLLEFFGSLYNQDVLVVMIKALKQLQATLGDFQDISTQGQNLYRSLDRMKAQGKLSDECLLASGALLAHQYSMHDQLRKQFFRDFQVFSDEELIAAVSGELKSFKESG